MHVMIGIDCAPGTMRPDSFLPIAVQGTPLDCVTWVNTSRWFGAWIFEADVDQHNWLTHRQTVHDRLSMMYADGLIRGARVEPMESNV